MTPRPTAIVSVLIAVVLLGAAAAWRLERTRPTYADAHHAEVRRAVARMPDTVAGYVAYDREVPAAAFDLLKPNATRARALRDADGHAVGTLVVVHCEDANDLRGHYPPVCYPAQGYREAEPPRRVTLDADGLAVPATEYRFVRGHGADARRLVVLNFMVLPTGAIEPTDAGLSRLASDYRQRFYGAGQVQVLATPTWRESKRDAFYAEVVADLRPVIEALRQTEAARGSDAPTSPAAGSPSS